MPAAAWAHAALLRTTPQGSVTVTGAQGLWIMMGNGNATFQAPVYYPHDDLVAIVPRSEVPRQGAKELARVAIEHATTLFTNSLIERKGARTGLLTTAGFRDVLEIGRERKYELYDLFIEMPKPLVPRP